MANTIFAKDHITIDELSSPPSATPTAGQVQLYGYNKAMYMKNSDGVISSLSVNAPAFAYIGKGDSGAAGVPLSQWDITLPTGYDVLRFLFRLKNDYSTAIQRNLYGRLDDVSTAAAYNSRYYNEGGTTTAVANTRMTNLGAFIYNAASPYPETVVWMDIHDADSATKATFIETKSFSANALYTYYSRQRRNAAEVNSTLNLYLNADDIVDSSYILWGLKALD